MFLHSGQTEGTDQSQRISSELDTIRSKILLMENKSLTSFFALKKMSPALFKLL